MNPAFAKWTERGISVLKYIIGGYMALAGIATMFATLEVPSGPLGFLYSSRISLIIIGALIAFSGLTLLYGKIRKSRLWTGRGLFNVYLCFLFASVLNFVAYNGDWTFWLGNAIAAIITGALYLRWKFKTEYINPHHFIRDIEELERQKLEASTVNHHTNQ